MSERITGYSLLIIGILLMIFSLTQIISVFTGRAKPIDMFQYEESADGKSSDPLDTTALLEQIQAGNPALQMPSVEIIDPNTLNNLLNLLVYYLIMQFLLGFGYKLSSLGIQLLRPIQVNMKNRELILDKEREKQGVNEVG